MSKRIYSGKFVVRVTPSLHERLCKSAQSGGVSLNQKCVEFLSNVNENDVYACKSNATLNVMQDMFCDFLDCSVIKRAFGSLLLGVVLFGSVSRGESGVTSDVDLLLVISDDVPINRSLYKQWDKEILETLVLENSRLNFEVVSPHFVHMKSPCELLCKQVGGLWLEVALDGHVIFEKDKLVSSYLCMLRRRIAEGRYRRKVSNGHPYWVYLDA